MMDSREALEQLRATDKKSWLIQGNSRFDWSPDLGPLTVQERCATIIDHIIWWIAGLLGYKIITSRLLP